jgi:hypothetical protein
MEAGIIQDDADLFEGRKHLSLQYTNADGDTVEASTLVLSTNLTSEDDEAVRKSSHEALLRLEEWVVNNGFIEMMKRRNAVAPNGKSATTTQVPVEPRPARRERREGSARGHARPSHGTKRTLPSRLLQK